MPIGQQTADCLFCGFPLLLEDRDDDIGSWCTGCGAHTRPLR